MRYFILAATVLTLLSCSAPVKRTTLRDIDFIGKKQTGPEISPKAKSADDIRRAYLEYLTYATKDDKSRVDALHRLAQLEFQVSESRNKEGKDGATSTEKDELYYASIDRNIELLQTLLRDHSKAESSDKTLYQLARAYDQRGLHDRSLETLNQLVSRYPKSIHYVESKFRLAERVFIKSNYGQAEDMYTDILVSQNNNLYREKARFKRGWARFKQNFYREAIDDFVGVIDMNDFEDMTKANNSEKNSFEEYFRGLGLSFIYMGGHTALHDYFKENQKFKYINQAYFRVSDLYLAEQRYADAANTLEQYNKDYPQSVHLAESALKNIDIWVASGFSANFIRSLDDFYAAYHPQSSYWSRPGVRQDVRATVTTSLRNYLVLASAHFHKDYQSSKNEVAFSKARIWYERYLKDYQAYSRKDNIHFLYAELLSQHKDYTEALTNYEYAAFDGNIIVNKDAGYAAILMATRLHETASDVAIKSEYLKKLVLYSQLYVQLYPGHDKSIAIMTRAAEEAYREEQYKKAIDLAELYSGSAYTTETYNLHSIKAHSYFKLERYQEAEAIYQVLLQHYKPDQKTKAQINDNLAISIYNQATAAKAKGNSADALRHYLRMAEVVPASENSASGLYEAITMTVEAKKWVEAVKYIGMFQKLYPSHKLNHDVSRKLSVAYLNTNQDVAAASELIKTSRSDENIDYRIAALWKAAGLYESRKDYPAAIKTYEEYATTYQRPYPQNMEAMHKLTELHTQSQNSQRASRWRNQILDVDKKTPGDLKTDRTNYITSMAAIHMARLENKQYSSIRLVLPLKQSLAQKKDSLQKALVLYGRVASYGIPETATEATYSIANIYHSFSKALLDSERPRNLNAADLEQYKILLEDQAFPFEDNAIKFYEKNLSHIKQGVSNDWTRKSLSQLKLLYPARYNREPLLEPYINVLH